MIVTSRLPADGLYADLMARQPLLLDGGHRAARELDAPAGDLMHADVPFRRERIALQS